RLKKEKNAVILVHNYQRPEIYKVADFIGDSYGLSVQASKTKADMIVFCGVHFMAETAYILNPGKKVLLPAKDAGCPMADMVTAEDIRELRKKYPDAAIVSYMNTTAEVKAESDIICTSSNAVKIVNSLPNKRIIFVPDKNLASYVAAHTDKEVIPWKGFCYVHNKFSRDGLAEAKDALKDAKVVVHPECKEEVRALADHVCSTSGMVDYAKGSEAKEFIIGTEVGMIEMLKIECPEKKFYSAPPGGTCVNMKKNNLDLVLEALKTEKPVVTVPEEVRLKAKKAIDKMLEVGK
ncbi:MAG: quinolinate synthase NadA, partial [Nanoarchaeota archaeon]|nr:quinolinate synthase NadA [Nanoarchaeota archaeon]